LTPFHHYNAPSHVQYPSCRPFWEELDDVPMP
jgi:hypothetical protein